MHTDAQTCMCIQAGIDMHVNVCMYMRMHMCMCMDFQIGNMTHALNTLYDACCRSCSGRHVSQLQQPWSMSRQLAW